MKTQSSAFTDIFIRRPVLAIVVNLVIVIAGLQAYRSLTVRQYPRNENAVITVTTTYVGANADLVRGFITTPVERVVASAEGIDYMESTSSQGVSSIKAHLKLNYDGNKALAEISTKVDQVRGDLPAGSEVPILTIETADSALASAYLRFSSESLAANQVTDYLTRVVQPRLSAVAGVQRADILGGRTFAMRIWLKPDRMASLNISPAQVRAALTANNYLAAVGQTRGSLISVNLTANTDLRSVDDFKKLVIRQQNGAIVRLSDISDVMLGADNYDVDVRFSGEPSVFIGVWALPNANTLDVMKGVRAEMEGIQKDLPVGMEAGVAYDATRYIEDAISEVKHTLIETLLIVVVVIFLFLGSFRSVLVPVIAIPVSLIGAVFIMQVFGFSINLLTLLAVVLSVGLVVDDAIVVVENVERHLAMGQGPIDAALSASRELVGPIIAMTITLVAVYAPIAISGGLTGAFFREFAFTLAGAVLISGIVALTLSPVMSAKLLHSDESERGLAGKISHGFEALKKKYASVLDLTLRSRPFIYTAWIVLSLLTLPMIMLSPKELAPAEDQGFILGIAETPANSTIDQTLHYSKQMFEVYHNLPEFAYSFQVAQPTFAMGGLVLTPWGERKRTAAQILPAAQQGVSKIPGIRANMVNRPALPSGGQFPVEFVIASTAEPEQVLEFAKQLQKKAVESKKFFFPPLIDVKFDQPQSEITIDRDKVAALGLNLQQVGQDLAVDIGGNYVNRFNIDGRSYKVIPQIKRVDRLNPDQLQNIYVTGPNGQLVPLSTVASITRSVQPRSLNRFQQLNAVKISGVSVLSLDEALRFFEDESAKILPKGYVVDYTGESRQLRKEGGNDAFIRTFGLAFVLIFLVLAAQFNSFRDPLIILFGSVPLAMFGASIFTFLKLPNPNMHFFTDGWTTTFNIYAQVGLVTLVGLVSKNGILIVEFANELQRQGHSKIDSIREAALTRLRPILMTSAATVFGHLPLTMVSGAGAAARNSIGLIVVGGMSIGTLFTLFVVPSLYILIAKDHSKGEGIAAVKPAGLPPGQPVLAK
jgi:multidrug efflux pump